MSLYILIDELAGEVIKLDWLRQMEAAQANASFRRLREPLRWVSSEAL